MLILGEMPEPALLLQASPRPLPNSQGTVAIFRVKFTVKGALWVPPSWLLERFLQPFILPGSLVSPKKLRKQEFSQHLASLWVNKKIL